jgi:quinol monooxygenase YgiN
MIILTLKLKPPLHSLQGSLNTLETSRPSIEGTAGCLEFSVTVEVPSDGAIHIVERWESEADLHRHLRSEGFKRILDLMELSLENPDLHVFHVEECSGFDVVDQVRSNRPAG